VKRLCADLSYVGELSISGVSRIRVKGSYIYLTISGEIYKYTTGFEYVAKTCWVYDAYDLEIATDAVYATSVSDGKLIYGPFGDQTHVTPPTATTNSIDSDGTNLFTIQGDCNLQKWTMSFVISYTTHLPGDEFNSDPWEMSFTPDDFGSDNGLILFSLSYTGSDTPTNPNARVTYWVIVNGDIAGTFHGKPWAGSPINDFDISDYCNLDGSEETIQIFAKWNYDIAETLEYTGTVRGITKP